MPVGFVDQGTLLVAVADPANVVAVDDVQIATGQNCRVAVAAAGDVDSLVARLGTLQSTAADAIVEEQHRVDEVEEEDDGGLAEVSSTSGRPRRTRR